MRVIELLLAGDETGGTQRPQQTTPLMAAIYAHAGTVKSQMQAPEVDPLNSQSIDLLEEAEEVL